MNDMTFVQFCIVILSGGMADGEEEEEEEWTGAEGLGREVISAISCNEGYNGSCSASVFLDLDTFFLFNSHSRQTRRKQYPKRILRNSTHKRVMSETFILGKSDAGFIVTGGFGGSVSCNASHDFVARAVLTNMR